MKTKTLHNTHKLSARLRTLFLMLVSLSMFNLLATVPTGAKELMLEDINYTLDESANTLTIDLYVGDTLPSDSALYIPSTYTIDSKVYTVTAIGYAVNDLAKNGFRNFDSDKVQPGVAPNITANLTSVIFPNTLEYIGIYTFLNCAMLETVIIPASVKEIAVSAFANIAAPATITFEDESQLELISKNAFKNQTFTLPSVRTGYDVEWYEDGNLLTDLLVSSESKVYTAVWTDNTIVPSTLTLKANGGVGSDSIIDTNVGDVVTLPADVFTNSGYYLKGWALTVGGAIYSSNGTDYTSLSATDELFAVWEMIPADFTPEREVLNLSEVPYSTEAGILTTAEGYTGDGTDIYIPSTYVIDGVTYTLEVIGTKTFKSKIQLTNVVLPSTLKEIGHTSFNGAGLDSIVIPASVESIVARAFKSCPNLSKVIIEEESLLSSLKIEVFFGCDNLPSFTLPGMRTGYTAEWSNGDSVLTNLVIPDTAFAPAYTAVWTEDLPTGIEEKNVVASSLTISPNPVAQSFTINVEAVSSSIYNLSGQCVKQFPAGTTQFDISSLDRGMYFITVEEANGFISTKQLIKK